MSTEDRFLGAATEEQIAAAEQQLGETFPAAFRTFLARHGAGIAGGIEVYGLGTAFAGPPNLMWLVATLERRGFHRPHGVVPISDVGNGDYYSLIAAPVASFPVGTVVYWSPRHDRELRLEKAHDDFEAFLSGG